MSPRYTVEFKKEAVALLKQDDRSVLEVAEALGVSETSLYRWLDLYGEGTAQPLPNEDALRIRELEREVRELRRANHILKTSAAFFAAELDRPTSK